MLFMWNLRAFCALVLGVAAAAGGHTPEGGVVRAFAFSASQAPVVDGDLTDWELVGPAHTIETSMFRDLVNDASIDAADFSVVLMTGWCDELNRIYIAAEVRDDLHQIDRPSGSAATLVWQDDAMEIFVDADHSGGQYANFTGVSEEEGQRMNGAGASHFVIAGPHPDGDFFINFSAAGWYAQESGSFTAAAFDLEGERGDATVMRYEFMIVPFDRIDISGDFLSDPHDLTAGEILGLNLEFDDYDSRSDLLDAKWSLSGGFNSPVLSERFTDLQLDFPPATTVAESRSWGRIKASFSGGGK